MYFCVKENDSQTPLYSSHETTKNYTQKGLLAHLKVHKTNCNYLLHNLQQQTQLTHSKPS